MAFEVTSLYDKDSGTLPLKWGKNAVAEGTFSDEAGRVLVDDVLCTPVSWTASAVEFIPVASGRPNGNYAVHIDNIPGEVVVPVGEYSHTFDFDLGTWTHTRGSDATYERDQGVAHISGDDPGWPHGGIQLEADAENLCTETDMTNNPPWATNGATSNPTVHHPTIPAPDGTMTANHVSVTNNASQFLSYSGVGVDGGTYSIWARTISGEAVAQLFGHNSVGAKGQFNLTTTWQRFEYTVDAGDTAGGNFYAPDWRGATNTMEMLLWGPQSETTPYATSFIPTSGGTVTRNETALSAPFSSLGPLPAGGMANNFSGQFVFVIPDVPFDQFPSNGWPLDIQSDDGVDAVLRIADAGVNLSFEVRQAYTRQVIVRSNITAFSPGDIIDARFRYEPGACAQWVNGVKSTGSGTEGDLSPPIDTVYINGKYTKGVTQAQHLRIRSGTTTDQEIEAWWFPYVHRLYEQGIRQLTHTRASSATALSANGVVALYPSNVPAWDSTNGLQVEQSSTNFVPYSEDFSQWIVRGPSIVATGLPAPDGTNTATHIAVLNGNSQDIYNLISGGTADASVALSIWIRSLNDAAFRIDNAENSSRGGWAVDGSLLPTGAWVRVTKDHPAVTESAAFVNSSSGSGGVHIRESGNVAEAQMYVWGAQWENNASFHSSYIPTSGGAATRSSTVTSTPLAALGGMPIGGITNNLCGHMRVRYHRPTADQAQYMRFLEISADGSNRIAIQSSAYVNINFQTRKGGTVTNTNVSLPTIEAGDVVDIRFKVSSTDGVVGWINGAKGTNAGNNGDFALALDTLNIGHDYLVGAPAHFTVEYLQLYAESLDDSVIEAWPHEYYHDFRTRELGGFTHTRGSNATAEDQWGIGQYSVDEPAWHEHGLQLEAARTNVVDNTDITTGGWANNGGTSKAYHATIPAPDGTLTAVHVQNVLGGWVTKAIGSDGQVRSMWIRSLSGTANVHILGYNTVAGTLTAITEEWQRFSLPVNTGDPGGGNFYVVDGRGSSDTDDILVWGPQCEDDFVTSFIPTSVGSVTRSAALAQGPLSALAPLPAAGVTNDFCGQMVCRLGADMADLNTDNYLFCISSPGDNVNRLSFRHYPDSVPNWRMQLRDRVGGAVVGSVMLGGNTTTAPILAGDVMDIRFKRSSTEGMSVWLTVNGVTYTASDPARTADYTTPVTMVLPGQRYDYSLTGLHETLIVESLRIVDKALTDEEIEAWT